MAAVRTYKNAKGEGRVGSIDLMDGSGDLKGTFFNDECDKWMQALEVNKVYKVRGGQIKSANKQYNQCKSDIEITFGRDSTFEPVSDTDAPKVTYHFADIAQIEQFDPQTVVDILAIVQVCAPFLASYHISFHTLLINVEDILCIIFPNLILQLPFPCRLSSFWSRLTSDSV